MRRGVPGGGAGGVNKTLCVQRYTHGMICVVPGSNTRGPLSRPSSPPSPEQTEAVDSTNGPLSALSEHLVPPTAASAPGLY